MLSTQGAPKSTCPQSVADTVSTVPDNIIFCVSVEHLYYCTFAKL